VWFESSGPITDIVVSDPVCLPRIVEVIVHDRIMRCLRASDEIGPIPAKACKESIEPVRYLLNLWGHRRSSRRHNGRLKFMQESDWVYRDQGVCDCFLKGKTSCSWTDPTCRIRPSESPGQLSKVVGAGRLKELSQAPPSQ
jgi:hypothetical protein